MGGQKHKPYIKYAFNSRLGLFPFQVFAAVFKTQALKWI